jgi:SAM-dependent MidA family methyltransferase
MGQRVDELRRVSCEAEIVKQLRERIARHGPVPFSEYVDAALYGPDGFYTRGGGAGRRRDFVTSPETGALFGAVIARALDTWWHELGQPDPFVVVEPGSGPGALVAMVLAASPECTTALRWLLVERSPAMRDLQRNRRLPLVDASQVMGVVAANRVDDELVTEPGQGPLVAQLHEMPTGSQVHIVIANELLDNVAFDIATFDGSRWCEVRVGTNGDRFTEVVVPGEAKWQRDCERYLNEPQPNVRIPIQLHAQRWLANTIATVDVGRVVLVDYGATTTKELATRPDAQWLRVYRGHHRLTDPLADPGGCDITSDVAVDQLAAIAKPIVSTQADFLRGHGIDEVVANALANLPTTDPNSLAAAKLTSFVSERELLLDPAGLGSFLVMEWKR